MKLSTSIVGGVLAGTLALGLAAVTTASATETNTPATTEVAVSASDRVFPSTLSLPDGSVPEGIAISGIHAYVTSFADGTVYKLNLATGRYKVLSPATGTGAVGIMLHDGRLFVAGGTAGTVRVLDPGSGEELASYTVGTTGQTFINDFTVLDGVVYATDTFSPVLHKLPLGENGELPAADQVETIALDGITYSEGFNVNGITTTPDGEALLLVQTNTGLLYRVEESTGAADQVDVGEADLTWGDGMLLEGNTLYVVRNFPNTVAVLELDDTGTTAALTDELTDPRFDTPTTIARFKDSFYLPNARFTAEDPSSANFFVTAIPDAS
ncbi:superoxide dismutase [Promicromonospora soli]|uniref:Superoxide dismutase n=1 Tax=Promicromonospora soli TaxID=2035533 RepID=A0A919G1S4_9MICO|nr:superoxide dismutase [Promicromonospora soli]GHH76281.1 hypothetical protein GCM10017772_34520 [Promicromonospora soli]